MRSGQFAIYNGKEYSAGVMNSNEIVLRSSDIEDLKNGFVRYVGYNKNIMYIKNVLKADVKEFYSISSYTFYMGYKAYIRGENSEEVAIVIENLLPEIADMLEMDRAIDNGIYEKWVKKEEIEILEEKTLFG